MEKLDKIIIHDTVGTYTPNGCDLLAYHYLIDGNGNVIQGKFRPEDNISCKDGKYAQHCGGGNTGAIGVSICACRDPKFPIKQVQFESLCKWIATLCKVYDIPCTSPTVMTHREFGLSHPKTSSAGKIDIDHLEFRPELKPDDIGRFIRTKIKWYMEQ